MKFKWLPVFDMDKCSGCRGCTSYCASGSLNVVDGEVTFQNPEACFSDGYCVRECPSGGIHMEWLPITFNSIHGKLSDHQPQLTA